jgi:hypothetical protein
VSSTGANPAQEPGAAREERALEAAGAAADGGRLLPGEDPARADAEDAASWVDVYSELLAFKQDLLKLTHARMAEMHQDPARQEVARTDAIVLHAEAERLAGRLGYWRRRLDEAGGADRR